jgi:hypothetical protein
MAKEEFAMSLAIPLREDFDAMTLRRLAKGSKDAAQTRRLIALAAIYDGASRANAAADYVTSRAAPSSPCFRMKAICCSENLDFFMENAPPVQDGLN